MPNHTRRTDKAGEELTRYHDPDTLDEIASIGVGDGSGNLFVKGSLEAVQRVQEAFLEKEALQRAQPFNKLSPAQAELLACLTEEAGEVGQAVGKILRHGYESHHPDFPMTSNRESLEKELGDVLAVQELLVHASQLNVLNNRRHADRKKKNLLQNWLHHN